jgi:hypothetical protein
VPPRFEGLPTASSQTVPMDGCFITIVSLRERGTTDTGHTGSPRRTASLLPINLEVRAVVAGAKPLRPAPATFQSHVTLIEPCIQGWIAQR